MPGCVHIAILLLPFPAAPRRSSSPSSMHHLSVDSCGDATARSKVDNFVRLHYLLSGAAHKPNLEQNVRHAVGLSGVGQATGVIFDVHLLQSIWLEKNSRGAYKMTCWVLQTSST